MVLSAGIMGRVITNYISQTIPLDTMQVKEVEIVPQTIYGITYYMLHLIYKKPIIQEPIKEGNILSIDLGIKNLATAVINTGSAIIYDGRRLISKFRWFAKIKGKLQSELLLISSLRSEMGL